MKFVLFIIWSVAMIIVGMSLVINNVENDPEAHKLVCEKKKSFPVNDNFLSDEDLIKDLKLENM